MSAPAAFRISITSADSGSPDALSVLFSDCSGNAPASKASRSSSRPPASPFSAAFSVLSTLSVLSEASIGVLSVSSMPFFREDRSARSSGTVSGISDVTSSPAGCTDSVSSGADSGSSLDFFLNRSKNPSFFSFFFFSFFFFPRLPLSSSRSAVSSGCAVSGVT